MKQLLTVLLILCVSAAAAQAQMVLYEDFESYAVDTSIHNQGTDLADVFGRTFRWQAQQNSSALVDSGGSYVRSYGGNQVLEMSCVYGPDHSSAGAKSTLATAVGMDTVAITGEGTIYMRYVAAEQSNPHVMTNSLERGWDYEGNAMTNPGVINAYGWQDNVSNTGYSHMGAIVRAAGDNDFSARDQAQGGYLVDTDIHMPIQKWIELWIQVDSANDRTKYYVCEQGGTPTQAFSPGPDGLNNTADDTEWWGMRNEGFDNNGVRNIKFIVSNWGMPEEATPILYVDTIGVNTSAMTLERVGPDAPPIPFGGKPGDLDGDGDVDLDDFVILKTNFGVGPGGDLDGDGDTDLDDFVILKSNFGT